MTACYRLGLSSDSDKTAVIQEIINSYVNSSGQFTNPSSIKVVTDYVKSASDFSDYKILDPGARTRTNLKQTMDSYGVTEIEYKKTF